MLNDTIVEYYMIHCLMRAKPENKRRIHLFNTFFYKKLRSSRGNLADLSRTWDKNVKLFDHDYLVVPVCSRQHWMLVIICYPANVPALNKPVVIIGDNRRRITQPMILIFDSLRFKYLNSVADPFRKFLQSRWEYERPDACPRMFMAPDVLKTQLAKVPQQRNPYDCGIFMLHFFQKFLTEPDYYKLAVMTQLELRTGWVVDASYLRNHIKDIIRRSKKSMTISLPEKEEEKEEEEEEEGDVLEDCVVFR